MKMDIGEHNFRGTREHLAYMVWQEHPHGQSLLSSIVEDSLLYTLKHHKSSPELSAVAKQSAKISVQTIAEMIHLDEVAVREAVQGVVKSMVRLGGNPMEIARAVIRGSWHGLMEISKDMSTSAFLHAIRHGVRTASRDMQAVVTLA